MMYETVDTVVTSNPSLLQQLMQEMRTECAWKMALPFHSDEYKHHGISTVTTYVELKTGFFSLGD
jgi:hypothetical protein